MDDGQISQDITSLVEEEHQLRRRAEAEGVTEEEQALLRWLEVERDRLCDLLRQRRARRETGQDPDVATERDAGTVEGFQQ